MLVSRILGIRVDIIVGFSMLSIFKSGLLLALRDHQYSAKAV